MQDTEGGLGIPGLSWAARAGGGSQFSFAFRNLLPREGTSGGKLGVGFNFQDVIMMLRYPSVTGSAFFSSWAYSLSF